MTTSVDVEPTESDAGYAVIEEVLDSEGRAAVAVAPPNPARPELAALLTRGIMKRRSVAIMGYVGLNGSFKTATAVRDSLPSLLLGRRILSTVEILDPWSGNRIRHPLFVPFRSWAQLHDFRDGDLFLDEVTGVMDARDQGMPKHVRKLLPQMRRRNVLIRWTGIDWDNSDRRLRQVTRAVAACRGMMPVKATATADTLDMWAPKRLAFVTTYDAQTLTSTDDGAQLTQETGKKRRARVLHRELWWGPGSTAFRAYDTLGEVSGVTSDCPICGGSRPSKVCRSADEHDALWLRELAGDHSPDVEFEAAS